MKRSRLILNVLTLLPFLAAAVALCLAPDEIPGHWNASGKSDRMGSKWEVLIWPVLVLLTRLGMAGLTKLVRTKDKNGAANATFLEHSTMVALAVFDFLSLYFMRAAVNQEFDVERYNRSVWQISMALTGASLIPVGNQMPKLKLNSTSGLRTKYSMLNEETWRLSQRFGGKAMMVSGIVIIILAFALPGIYSFFAAMGVLIIMCIVDSRYAKWAYYKTMEKQEPPD